ncbi:MAG: hypothetical protein HC769_37910 [Cyanobacteria bacterium CRU_2_1]|nr:hypothetical protein [Leptolyngbyaceae cyanobacterium SU_3_3]NJR64024.1 hypothetical protein [Cyanobacteria bacterium CRU_2_1]
MAADRRTPLVLSESPLLPLHFAVSWLRTKVLHSCLQTIGCSATSQSRSVVAGGKAIDWLPQSVQQSVVAGGKAIGYGDPLW